MSFRRSHGTPDPRNQAVSGWLRGPDGAAQESNLPSLGLPDLTGFEDRLDHRVPPLRAQASGLTSRWSAVASHRSSSPAASRSLPGSRCLAVESDRDCGVDHVAAESFGVDAGGDHEGGIGVAAVVQANRLHSSARPCFAGSGSEAARVARVAFLLAKTMPEQAHPKCFGDRYLAPARPAPRLNQARARISGTLDANYSSFEIDVRPVERLQLATA